MDAERQRILIGQSGAKVFRVRQGSGEWFEKNGPPEELQHEAAVLAWCSDLLPVPRVISYDGKLLITSAIEGADLTHADSETAIAVLADALHRIHRIAADECPFDGRWQARVREAERRVAVGLVDEADFDEANMGRSAEDVLNEIKSFPALPISGHCFTHGDACLPNFLSLEGRLTGIVDWGRAGVAHPAQDWALALRSLAFNFGDDAAARLRQHVPSNCDDDQHLRRFLLLDELF